MAAKRKKRVVYNEGDWFAIPLTGGGYAVGIAARVGKRGIVFGYFFGPMYTKLPTLDDVDSLTPDQSTFVTCFGDLGLLRGSWPVIGHDQGWDRAKWPIPSFARVHEREGKAWRVEYSEDTLTVAQEVLVIPDDVRHLPKDGLAGYRFVERRLSKLLKLSEA